MTANTCGHPDRPHRAKGKCGPCYMTDYLKENPEVVSGNAWLKAHPEAARAHAQRQRLRKRNCTPEQYEQLWNEQGGKCANPRCQAAYPLWPADRRGDGFHVDENHATGEVRGLLCPGCNVALGQVADSQERLLGLVEYLRLRT